MSTRPLIAAPTTQQILEESQFGANFVAGRREVVIWECPIVRNVTGPADLENYDGLDYVAVASSQTCGVKMANGGDINLMWWLPNELDVTQDIEFNLLCSNSETVDATKYHTFVTLYKALIVGTTAVAIPATAVTSEMATIKNIGANILQKSATWAKIAGATVTAAGVVAGRDALMLMFTDTITGSADLSVYKVLAKYGIRQL
jgi:hypothetical protein